MNLKRLALAAMTTAVLAGCAGSLRTRQEPDQARTGITAVLQANGFDTINTIEEAGQWRIVAERRQNFDLTEKRFAIEQAPSLQTDPVNNNMTVFEERVNPTKFTLTQRAEPVSYRAEIRLPRTGPERAVTVSVTGTTIPVSNKFREILWTHGEPPSPLQVETAIYNGLAKAL
jgi:hypothetical protein